MMEDDIRKGMYLYVRLGHFAVQEKLAQHCKPTIIKHTHTNCDDHCTTKNVTKFIELRKGTTIFHNEPCKTKFLSSINV